MTDTADLAACGYPVNWIQTLPIKDAVISWLNLGS